MPCRRADRARVPLSRGVSYFWDAPFRKVARLYVVPQNARCLESATIKPLGSFTGRSFEFSLPARTDECFVPAGMVLKSQEGRQDMLVMASERVGAGTNRVTIYANCMDISKPGPKPESKYAIGGMVAQDSELGKLVASAGAVPADRLTPAGLQAAVWSIANDASRQQIAGVMPFGDADVASARALLEAAGLSTSGRALFR